MERQLLKLVITSVVSRLMLNYLGNRFGVIGELRTHCIGCWMPHVNVDDCRIKKNNAPENFAVMCRLAVNLLGRDKSHKRGMKNKQFLAAMDNEYLTKVLAAA